MIILTLLSVTVLVGVFDGINRRTSDPLAAYTLRWQDIETERTRATYQ